MIEMPVFTLQEYEKLQSARGNSNYVYNSRIIRITSAGVPTEPDRFHVEVIKPDSTVIGVDFDINIPFENVEALIKSIW